MRAPARAICAREVRVPPQMIGVDCDADAFAQRVAQVERLARAARCSRGPPHTSGAAARLRAAPCGARMRQDRRHAVGEHAARRLDVARTLRQSAADQDEAIGADRRGLRLARVIKVEAPGTATTPAARARRSSGPRTPGSRRTSSRPTATRSRSPSTSRTEADRDVLLQLVDRADVLVENFRTGVLERLAWASRRCSSATRGWWCCRSPASATTVPRAVARATTRSPRARPG